MEHLYILFPQGTLVEKEHLQHSINAGHLAPLFMAINDFGARALGYVSRVIILIFSVSELKVECYLSTHAPTPSKPFGDWEYKSALGYATLILDPVDFSIFLSPLYLRRTTPQAKEGRGNRKEVRAVLTTEQGGFATFLVEDSVSMGERVEPRKMADSAHPGLDIK